MVGEKKMNEEDLNKINQFIKELNNNEALNLDDIEDIVNSLSEFNGEKEVNETFMVIPADIVADYKAYADYVEKQLKENNYPIVFEEWYDWFREDDEE